MIGSHISRYIFFLTVVLAFRAVDLRFAITNAPCVFGSFGLFMANMWNVVLSYDGTCYACLMKEVEGNHGVK
jgi:hypothetical protein